MTIALIAAVADNGVIGRDGELPWHHPEDMAHFKETTMGHPVIMGRVTYEGIVDALGGPLPGRTTVVLTSMDRDLPAGAVAVDSIEAALAAARDALEGGAQQGPTSDGDAETPDAAAEDDTIYVAGGETVYEQFLPRADRLVLTEVHDAPEGDAHFPTVEWSTWREVERDDREALSFVTYDRRE